MVKQLITGFTDFRKNFFGKDSGFYQKLTRRGQTPKIMVIACSDSRVDPAILFGTRPGELFVIRNVANLVPPYQPDDSFHGTSAAIEFGVRDLEIQDIVIVGHAFCGGIDVLCSHTLGEKDDNREFITSWIKIALPAMESINKSSKKEDMIHDAEKASIVNSIKNLRTFPWIVSLEEQSKLRIHGWWFDMEHGALWTCEDGQKEFYKLIPNK